MRNTAGCLSCCPPTKRACTRLEGLLGLHVLFFFHKESNTKLLFPKRLLKKNLHRFAVR